MRTVLNIWRSDPANLESLLDRLEAPAATFKTTLGGGGAITVGHVVAITDEEQKKLIQLLRLALE